MSTNDWTAAWGDDTAIYFASSLISGNLPRIRLHGQSSGAV